MRRLFNSSICVSVKGIPGVGSVGNSLALSSGVISWIFFRCSVASLITSSPVLRRIPGQRECCARDSPSAIALSHRRKSGLHESLAPFPTSNQLSPHPGSAAFPASRRLASHAARLETDVHPHVCYGPNEDPQTANPAQRTLLRLPCR